MHSSQLPTTEWWDPDWDIYDVPMTPGDGWWEKPLPPPEVIDAWWAAYCFLWDLRWIMDGTAEYRPDFRGRELTTGHGPLCATTYGEHCDHLGCVAAPPVIVRPRPVERFGKAPHCMCRYDLRYVAGVTGTTPLDPFRHSWHRGVWAFRIHPKCPHHGDHR